LELTEALWEGILAYTRRGVPAVNKVTAKALRSRAKRPYFLTALHELEPNDDLDDDDDDECSGAAAEAVRAMLSGLSLPAAPQLVLVFACGRWSKRLEELRGALRRRLPADAVVAGGASVGVVCATPETAHEVEDGKSTVALALLRCAAVVSVATVPVRANPHASVGSEKDPSDGSLGGASPQLMIVLAQDPRAAREAIQLCDERRAQCDRPPAVTGGLLGDVSRKCLLLDAPGFPRLPSTPSRAPPSSSSAGSSRRTTDDGAARDKEEETSVGAVIVTLSGACAAASAASRGARVVGPHAYALEDVATRSYAVCPGHSVHVDSLGAFRPVAERSDSTFATLLTDAAARSPASTLNDVVAQEHWLPRPLFLGVKKKDDEKVGFESGFALLAPANVDEHGLAVDSSGVGLSSPLESGDVAAWFTLSAAASRSELRRAAAACRSDLRLGRVPLRGGLDDTLSVLGGLVFTCCGRGQNFHNAKNCDSDALAQNGRGLPLVGCFCNGEIGPPPFDEFGGGTSTKANTVLSGYTCQAAILRLDGAPLHDSSPS